eukprot:GEMP01018722.1.p1 GENE.GEMP01018722.1~~GEMP01018722.1.p1  ORF type:complete len:213 (+),score=33.34 GEMP01018722.1:77-715(+)
METYTIPASSVALPSLSPNPTLSSEPAQDALSLTQSSGFPTLINKAKRTAKPSSKSWVKLQPLIGAGKLSPAANDAVVTNSQGRVISSPEHEKSKVNFYPCVPGEVENDLLDKVIRGDVAKVIAICSKHPNIFESKWGGGLTKTSLLYACKRGNLDMIKALYLHFGPRSLEVQDYKGRRAVDYAKDCGINLSDFLDRVDKDSKLKMWSYFYS